MLLIVIRDHGRNQGAPLVSWGGSDRALPVWDVGPG